MSRKKRDLRRPVEPDPRFHDEVVTKTINIIMKHGKRGVAERAVHEAIDKLAEKSNRDGVEAFHEALSNIKPVVEVRSRRVGGANYQVPTEVHAWRAQSLALRWLKQCSNQRSERTLRDRLSGELLDALQNSGLAVKKREDTHRMAEANKAFAHFKW